MAKLSKVARGQFVNLRGHIFEESARRYIDDAGRVVQVGIDLPRKGRKFIQPDIYTDELIGEIKSNTKKLDLTDQIQREMKLARMENKAFQLMVAPETRLTPRLQRALFEAGGDVYRFDPLQWRMWKVFD